MKRIAVVGFGFMGMTHSINILKNKDLKLVAIVDSDLSVIDKNLSGSSGNFSTGNIDAGKLAGIKRYSSLDDCLLAEELDAVSICVHVNHHYEMTKKVLLNEKHVFLEKPFCLDVKQAQELIDLAHQQKKILMVGHVVRFMPPYQKLKQWIDSKDFGRLKFLSLSRFCGLPAWGQWKEKQVRESSGGALFDLVIHDIDFVSYALGLPSEIKCNYLPGDMSKHDYISAMWNYKDKNINIKIEGGFTFHTGFPFNAGYMAQFEKASVLFTTLNGDVIRIADDENVRDVAASDGSDGYYNEILYFTRCMENNTMPENCMPESSLQSIKLCYDHI